MTLHLHSVERAAVTPPPRFDEIEAFVMASYAPAVVMIDRALMRELLVYIRHIERQAAEAGSFW